MFWLVWGVFLVFKNMYTFGSKLVYFFQFLECDDLGVFLDLLGFFVLVSAVTHEPREHLG